MHSSLLYRSVIRPLLFSLDAESAHNLALTMSRVSAELIPSARIIPPTVEARSFCGMSLPNPIGLAAGLDKNAVAIPFFAALGFGHVEIGTVTPQPQSGNPRPRMFRLESDEALINRMGFPSLGADHVARNLARTRDRLPEYVIGVNIGKNKDTPIQSAEKDYCLALEKLAPFASYVTINVSSPNTPELRSLQHGELLKGLLTAVQSANRHQRPLCLKIAPDVASPEITEIVEIAAAHRVAAIIATNTTLQRPSLKSSIEEVGGLSGAPLYPIASSVTKEVIQVAAGRLDVIAAGGIRSAAQVHTLLTAGAKAVQLYSALVFEGPSLVGTLLADLKAMYRAMRVPAEH